MAIALHQYEKINAQQEAAELLVKYGPPAHEGKIQTEDVYIQSATGVYVPRDSFPADKTPTLRLEDAIAELYRVRGIEPKGETGRVKTSAERTC